MFGITGVGLRCSSYAMQCHETSWGLSKGEEGNEAGVAKGLVGGLKCYKLLQMVAYINLRSMLDCSKLKLDP